MGNILSEPRPMKKWMDTVALYQIIWSLDSFVWRTDQSCYSLKPQISNHIFHTQNYHRASYDVEHSCIKFVELLWYFRVLFFYFFWSMVDPVTIHLNYGKEQLQRSPKYFVFHKKEKVTHVVNNLRVSTWGLVPITEFLYTRCKSP